MALAYAPIIKEYLADCICLAIFYPIYFTRKYLSTSMETFCQVYFVGYILPAGIIFQSDIFCSGIFCLGIFCSVTVRKCTDLIVSYYKSTS